jgi:hypothetical protein
MVLGRFLASGLSAGDDAQYIVGALAMDDNQNPQPLTVSKQDESFFDLGMVGIVNDQSLGIVEYASSFQEGNAVLLQIPVGLDRVPFELHGMYIQ